MYKKKPLMLRSFFASLVVCGPYLSAAPENSTTTSESTETEKVTEAENNSTAFDAHSALTKHLKQMDAATEVVWLEDTEQGNFGLYRPALGKPGFGSLVILHDNAHNPDWPGVVRSLRRQLPEKGWNTFSISVPPLTDADAGSLESSNPLNQSLTQALAYLANKSSLPIIVVATGTSATLAPQLSPFWLTGQVAGLVLIDPAPIPSDQDPSLSPTAVAVAIPVLDLVPAIHPRSDPERRLQQEKTNYQQRVLPGTQTEFEGNAELVVKQIHSWGKARIKRFAAR